MRQECSDGGTGASMKASLNSSDGSVKSRTVQRSPGAPRNTWAEPTRSEWAGLDGKRVALYSLQESALRRAASVIKTLCPGVRVDTFQDHVGGSAALRTAAITADISYLPRPRQSTLPPLTLRRIARRAV